MFKNSISHLNFKEEASARMSLLSTQAGQSVCTNPERLSKQSDGGWEMGVWMDGRMKEKAS